MTRTEIHAFSDASQHSIGVAIYLRLINKRKEVSVTLLSGHARVALTHSTTIPQLELCAAVLSTRTLKKLLKELSLEIDQITFYTDSKVALDYIKNQSCRFYVYVANRVQMIRNISNPSQWKYIDTATNPADLATHGITATNLMESQWLSGPEFLRWASFISPLGEEIPPE